MIQVEGLTAGYGKLQVISRFSFQAQAEDSPIVLAGKNGSGKSTFLKAILGQIPFEGNIKIESNGAGIAWIPQAYHISLGIPVLDFIALGTSKSGGFLASLPIDAKQRAENALAELGLEKFAGKRTDELSGGEWQMICLAQLMVQDAQIWLLDEPTSSLDIYYKTLVFNLLWKKAEEGKLILFSTHDLPFLPAERGTILLFENMVSVLPISAENLKISISALSRKH